MSDEQNKTIADNVIIYDIADGIEPIPVKVINNFDDTYPFSFEYGSKHRLTKEVKQLLHNPTPTDGCDCATDCNPKTCRCQAGSTVKFYSNVRRVSLRSDTQTVQSDEYQYIECGKHCGCHGKCGRQLSRDTIFKKMEIRYKPVIGFIVTACQHIAPGMPILNYVGSIVINGVNEDFDPDFGTDYTFNLYEGDLLVHCDAAKYGNISRFISHSCYPNACLMKVYPCNKPAETDKLILPKLVIVALRSIVPGDEITIDYGIDYFRERDLPCLCYNYNCRAPPDDFEEKCKTLDDINKERAKSRRQVQANMDDSKDL
uniref:SET domain-containing protein n=1 Tax=Panagrellus redivivus TaxID=6233 RepID=A0A7E4UL82_PANRE